MYFIQRASKGNGIWVELKIDEGITDGYLFRSDCGGVGGLSGFEAPQTKSFEEIFDNIVNQKGVGHKATNTPHSGTFVSENPVYAEGYTIQRLIFSEIGGKTVSEKAGFWIISKDAFTSVSLKSEDHSLPAHSEIEFADIIPLKYVKFLIVSPETRINILTKYGEDNIEIFGRPLRDVLIANEGHKMLSFTNTFIKAASAG